ncbi:MAG: large subunit ribosomal protein L19e [Candidatus Methanomethylophilaceae archaeon]|nr:large subunit ribosomal protein L19e [Candidatus Methanomethylophilaceae archaeon]MDI3541667.1 large subunit ribosomal protein L19e [Candidatus Methanomethylophilaceae archaeon]
MNMDLSNQRRMAAEVLKCGENRVWIDPNSLEEVADCITRADIRTAVDSGIIKALPKKGVSRGRARYIAAQKSKGRRKGHGSRKGTINARLDQKGVWMTTIRALRDELKTLRDEGKISPSVYRTYYLRAKGGMYKSRKNMIAHMISEGHLEEDN